MPCLDSELKHLEADTLQTEKPTIIKCSPKKVSLDIPENFKNAYDVTIDAINRTVLVRDFEKEYHAIEYSLRNYGAGNAHKICFEYYADSIMAKPVKAIDTFTLLKDEKRVFILIFSKEKWLYGSNEVFLELVFSYKDVELRSVYGYKETIKFSCDENGMLKITTANP
jgi:hypothetical protein